MSRSSDTRSAIACRDGRIRRGRTSEAVGDVVEHIHVAEERVGLENESDPALLDRMARGVFAIEGDCSLRRGFQPGEEPKQRGLTRPGRPEQRQKFSWRDIEIDVVENKLGAERLRKAANRNGARRAECAP